MLYKCKVCGGELTLLEDGTTFQCEYCGVKQTMPIPDSQTKLDMYVDAFDYIAEGDFDTASFYFRRIMHEYDEAEAYWGLLLCKFGMRYETAPGTNDKLLTCHRLSFNSVKDDENYKKAIEKADFASKQVYEDEAEKIENIRLRAIELCNNEDPYDVFICYKDKEENGDRTIDSVEAERIYDELAKKGLKIFFARRTLAQKPGIEFEPYIFAALNSAKVMLVVGTSYDHFTAPWVKNEWSRFLTIKAKKQVWIYPCYKYISDPQKDLPQEFRSLESIDLSKVGAMQDLLRAIRNAVGSESQFQKTSIVVEAPDKERFLTQAMNYLKAGQMDKAKRYFQRFIDDYPEDYRGWWGAVRAQTNNLIEIPFGQRDLIEDYKRALRFSAEPERSEIKGQFTALVNNHISGLKGSIQNKRNEYNIAKERYAKVNDQIMDLERKKSRATEAIKEKEKYTYDGKEASPGLWTFLVMVSIFSGVFAAFAVCALMDHEPFWGGTGIVLLISLFIFSLTVWGTVLLKIKQGRKTSAREIIKFCQSEIPKYEEAIRRLQPTLYQNKVGIDKLNNELNTINEKLNWYGKLLEI